MSRLIVVSNRVAVPQPGAKAAGGLAVAVNAALRERGGVWFGWSGRIVENPSPEPEVTNSGNIDYCVTDLTSADLQEYYNGFANRVLWPLMHYRVDLAEFSRSDLSGYMRVNRDFADQVSRMLKPDDVVWIHDYHLMPLAKFLRERGHMNKIGFFLHIPFPSLEIIQALPHHREVTAALVHYDLVGLQTQNDSHNFMRYLESLGGKTQAAGSTVAVEGRKVQIGAFPVGIETAEFARCARRVSRSAFVKEVKISMSGRSLVIGVDRLDYSKGIPERMDAFERFLVANEGWHNRVTYLQVTPKSRSEVREYAEMEQLINAKTGQVNGDFGEAIWTPIRYVNRSYSRTALAGLYRMADVGLVTPLRDGMNLVAKEYVAAQNPDDPGVLILSQFAGAAFELGEGALLVNPHEAEAVAAALKRALEMSIDERRLRHSRMLRTLLDNDIHQWAARFLAALTDDGTGAQMVGVGGIEPAPRRAGRGTVFELASLSA
ncbi:MAG TPA: alpha,alpha-trehalose-phosphate synthase (UDP-forming) [Parvibaculum sp.]